MSYRRTRLSLERLREVLDYNPETGIFTWKKKTYRKVVVGRQAGSRQPSGYIAISIDGVKYLAHRLAWLHVHGEWPSCEIRYRDGDRSNTRLSNFVLLSAEPVRKRELTADRLREIVDYDPETGLFRWKVKHSRKASVGKVAGGLRGNGYRYLQIDKTPHLAHRLAWLYMYGIWPKNEIDHQDRDRDNNRIANLRDATRSQNVGNTLTPSHNTSGHKGVHWDNQRGKWRAQLSLRSKPKCLGHFDRFEDAVACYRQAAIEHFGEFARFE